MRLSLFLSLHSECTYSLDQFGQLTKKDQPFYQNESFKGKNQRQRIDSIVVEINKLYKEINMLKKKIEKLENQKEVKK